MGEIRGWAVVSIGLWRFFPQGRLRHLLYHETALVRSESVSCNRFSEKQSLGEPL